MLILDPKKKERERRKESEFQEGWGRVWQHRFWSCTFQMRLRGKMGVRLHGWKFAPATFKLWLLMHPRGFPSASLKVNTAFPGLSRCSCSSASAPLQLHSVGSVLNFAFRSVRTTCHEISYSAKQEGFCASFHSNCRWFWSSYGEYLVIQENLSSCFW